MLLAFLESSSLATSVAKTFKGTPEQVFAATEKALRENSLVLFVEPHPQELKIQFKGPRTSGLEHYSAFSGEASVSRLGNFAGKCVLMISVYDVHVSSTADSPQLMGPAVSSWSEKSFANSLIRRVRRILRQ